MAQVVESDVQLNLEGLLCPIPVVKVSQAIKKLEVGKVLEDIATSPARRPKKAEMAPIKGAPAQGVLYAYTLGMAPWAKESARIHWVAYIRGIIIHVGIFVAAAFLIASPWLAQM